MQNMRDYTLNLFDLDGTIYHGDSPIPSAIEYVNKLISLRKEVVMLTNNSTITEQSVKAKLARFGVKSEFVKVVGTAHVTAWLAQKHNIKKAYIIGEESMHDICAQFGVEHSELGAEAVIAGLNRNGTITQLEIACKILQQQELPFYATNYDFRLAHDGYYLPGAGNFVRTIEMAAAKKAVVIGKPNQYMMQYLQEIYHHIPKNEWLMIGDNYDTDILFGIHNDIDTCFVNTGVTSMTDIENKQQQPTFILEEL